MLRFCLTLALLTVGCGRVMSGPPPDFDAKAGAALGSTAGAIVVMRVRDGEVLTVVHPDMACTTQHPPGSIFKLVTAYAALQERAVSERDTFRCTGRKQVEGSTLNCTVPNGHGKLTLVNAIAQSCNVTFYGLGLELGSARLLKYAGLLGLGDPCATFDGPQNVQNLPDPPIHPIETARLAIGQADGVQINLLQAAEMTRRIASGKGAAWATVRSGMRRAVLAGTCKHAAVPGCSVAGKTGTPESPSNEDERCAWFVGFAPFDNPEIVVVVFARRGHGYDTAAPIAARVFASYFGKD